MCNQYQNNSYPVLWILHLIMVLSIMIGIFKLNYTIIKKFIGFVLLVFHSFWLVVDIMCYVPTIGTTIALFFGMYLSILTVIGVFDCRCFDQDAILEDYLNQIDIEENSE